MVTNKILSGIIILVWIGDIYSYPQCRMPNGFTGECKYLDKCKPLKEINEKKTKTDEELLYLRESSCGTTSNYLYKVCCPLQSEWSKKLDLKPVLFDELVEYLSEPRRNGSNTGTSVNSRDATTSSVLKNREYNKDNEECGVDVSGARQDRDWGTAEIDEYPWLTLLEYRFGRIVCGGSLISLNFVLTAAHCIETSYGRPTSVRLAEYNVTSYPTDYVEVDGGFDTITATLIAVKWSEKHPLFDKTTYQHDIGLVKLAEDVTRSDFIRPICLPRYNFADQFDHKTNFMTAGWGVDSSIHNEVKMEARLPYMSTPICKRSISTTSLTNKQLCAGGSNLKANCVCDSGGPLMFESENYYMVVGVASYGPANCSRDREPTVYTNVYEYLEWIDNTMMV